MVQVFYRDCVWLGFAVLCVLGQLSRDQLPVRVGEKLPVISAARVLLLAVAAVLVIWELLVLHVGHSVPAFRG